MPYSDRKIAVKDYRLPFPNQKWEMFAGHVAQGKNHTQAAILAGYAEGSAAVRGCELYRRPLVQARIQHLKNSTSEMAIQRVSLSKSWVLLSLRENVEKALAEADRSAVNRGLELIGKELGMFVDRKLIGVEALISELTPRNIGAIGSEGLLRIVKQLEIAMTEQIECAALPEVAGE